VVKVPWDVLAKRFGHYLEFTYVALTVSGLLVAIEVILIVLPGNATNKRKAIGDAFNFIRRAELSTIQLLILGILAVMLGYMIGRAALAFILMPYNTAKRLQVVLHFLQPWKNPGNPLHFIYESPLGKLWRRLRSQITKARMHRSSSSARGFTVTHGGREYDMEDRRDRISYFFTFLERDSFTPAEVLARLRSHHGEQAVNAVLAAHPLALLRDTSGNAAEAGGVYSAVQYAIAWMQRNVPEFSITSLNVAPAFYSIVLPIALLPFAARAVDYQLLGFSYWPITLLLSGALALWMLRRANQSSRRFSILVFENFVVNALVAENSPEQSRPAESQEQKAKSDEP
jgi:hypothetical protein